VTVGLVSSSSGAARFASSPEEMIVKRMALPLLLLLLAVQPSMAIGVGYASRSLDLVHETDEIQWLLAPPTMTTWRSCRDDGGRFESGAASFGPRNAEALPVWTDLQPGSDDSWEGPSTGRRDRVFLRSWVALTAFELAFLGGTACLPRDWTGWSDDFVQDGLSNMKEAYTRPPVWDTDHWAYNYIGHPYGGAVYYNTVRCQGASRTESFLFVLLASTQWEYVFEAFAEQPSIQDLIITPIAGRILGEIIHELTLKLVSDGSGFLEKVLITVLNPTYTIFVGF
jgi:hypothetical protein